VPESVSIRPESFSGDCGVMSCFAAVAQKSRIPFASVRRPPEDWLSDALDLHLGLSPCIIDFRPDQRARRNWRHRPLLRDRLFGSAAVTTPFLIGAIVVANLPRLYRWVGVAQATVMGALFLALGTLGWALAQQHWHLFLAAFASGAGWVAMGAAAVNALIAPWFTQRRPAALSMAYNGASLGGVIFSPLWIMLIATIGFKFAALADGGVMVLVIATLSVWVFSKTPEGLRQVADGGLAPPETGKTTPILPARGRSGEIASS